MKQERILVTGSAGHLGEALVRVLRAEGREAVGLDLLASPFTGVIGSVADRDLVRESLAGVTAVLRTATLHKPHIGSHDRQAFVETNITGTLVLLEEAVAAGVLARSRSRARVRSEQVRGDHVFDVDPAVEYSLALTFPSS